MGAAKRGFTVAHQKVSVQVDVVDKKLSGWTELTVVPSTLDLKHIRLDARRLVVHGCEINGRPAKFVHNDLLSREIHVPKSWDVHNYSHYAQKIAPLLGSTSTAREYVKSDNKAPSKANPFAPISTNSLPPLPAAPGLNARGDDGPGELLIRIPRSVKVTEATDASFMASQSSKDKACEPLTLRIEYTVDASSVPNEGLRFVTQNPNEPHVYTTHSPIGQSTSCWLPCVDGLWSLSTWELEFSVQQYLWPHRIPDGTHPEETENSEAINKSEVATDAASSATANGDEDVVMVEDDSEKPPEAEDNSNQEMLVVSSHVSPEESMDPNDSRRKVVKFTMFNPVSSQHVGFAIGPFKAVPLIEREEGSEGNSNTASAGNNSGNANGNANGNTSEDANGNTKEDTPSAPSGNATGNSNGNTNASANTTATANANANTNSNANANTNANANSNANANPPANKDGEGGEGAAGKNSNNILPMTAFALPSQTHLAAHTCAPLVGAMSYFTRDFGSFPYDGYSLCFVGDYPYDMSETTDACALSICNAALLFSPDEIEPRFTDCHHLVRGIAAQWSGVSIVPATCRDIWITEGIAGFMTNLFVRRLMGNNEFRYRVRRANETLCREDIDQPPIGAPLLPYPLSVRDLRFIRLKAPLVLFILDRRMTKTDRSLGMSRVLTKLFLQSMSGDLRSQLSTAHFVRQCEKVAHHRLSKFFDEWVFGSGYPIFRITQRFNKKRLCIEMGIGQVHSRELPAETLRDDTLLTKAIEQLETVRLAHQRRAAAEVENRRLLHAMAPDGYDDSFVGASPGSSGMGDGDADDTGSQPSFDLPMFDPLQSLGVQSLGAQAPGISGSYNILGSLNGTTPGATPAATPAPASSPAPGANDVSLTDPTFVVPNFLPPSYFSGPMTIRIHEANGTPYEHVVELRDQLTKIDIPYNTKYKRLRRNQKFRRDRELDGTATSFGGNSSSTFNGGLAGSVEEGEVIGCLGDVLTSEAQMVDWSLVDWGDQGDDDEETMFNEAFEWLRADADFEWLGVFSVSQPDYMYASQLQQDQDVVAQYDAVRFYGRQTPHPLYYTVLLRTLLDARYFYGVRVAAAFELTKSATPDLNYAGMFLLLRAFREMFCFPNSRLPRANNFSDIPQYLVQKAIPVALSYVRNPVTEECPPEIGLFVLDLIRYNENSENPFSDSFYLAQLLEAITTTQLPVDTVKSTLRFDALNEAPKRLAALSTDSRTAAYLTSVVAEISKSQRLDQWVPSHRSVITTTALRMEERLIEAGFGSPRLDKLLLHTRPDSPVPVRVAALQSLLELGAYQIDEVIAYFEELVIEDAATDLASVREGLIDALRLLIGHTAIAGEYRSSKPSTAEVAAAAAAAAASAAADGESGEAEAAVEFPDPAADAAAAMTPRQRAVARKSVRTTIPLVRASLGRSRPLQRFLWTCLRSPQLGALERRSVLEMCAVLYAPAQRMVVKLHTPPLYAVSMRRHRRAGEFMMVTKFRSVLRRPRQPLPLPVERPARPERSLDPPRIKLKFR